MFTLRQYQREAVDALYNGWRAKRFRNPLVVAPTGSGKSAMIAALNSEALKAYPQTRIINATHRPELVKQNRAQLVRFWPEAPVGTYAAKLKSREIAPITFALIQSIHKRAYEFQAADLLVIDEAHLLSPRADSMYGRFIADCLKINPAMRVVGFTATDFRLDSGLLIEAYNKQQPIFDAVAHKIPMLLLIEQGYLVPLIPYASKSASARLDVSGVRKIGGDYVVSELQAAVDKDDVNRAIAIEVAAAAESRRKVLGFCTGVKHAIHMAEALIAQGMSAAAVYGDMSQDERDRLLAAHRRGEIKALTCCDLLTTGYDDPEIDLIFDARPTESAGLLVQMYGRGMRPAAGKTHCVVLGFAGNHKHGPIDKIEGRSKRAPKANSVAPMKECPDCNMLLAAGTRLCPCGHEFEMSRETVLATKASERALISTFEKPTWLDVRAVSYHKHRTSKGPHAMRVDYDCGMLRPISEYVNLENDSIPAQNAARNWIFMRSNKPGTPRTVDEAIAMADHLAQPGRIEVFRNGKHINVVKVDLSCRPIGAIQ